MNENRSLYVPTTQPPPHREDKVGTQYFDGDFGWVLLGPWEKITKVTLFSPSSVAVMRPDHS